MENRRATLTIATWAARSLLVLCAVAVAPPRGFVLADSTSTSAAAASDPGNDAVSGVPPADPTEAGGSAALTGLAVARRVDAARRASTDHTVMTMTLTDTRGATRVRTVEGWSREVSHGEDHRFARFLAPADVKDTTLLTYDYDDKDDDIWLYLPALKKVKRILASDKTDYFMGSDFTYWDMENLDLTNWSYQITGRDVGGDAETVELTALPQNEAEREESGYHKVVYWVAEKDWVPRRIEYTDEKGRLAKRLALSDVKTASNGGNRVRAHRLLMDNLLTGHQTGIVYSLLEVDVAVDDEVFSQRSMRP